MRACPSVGWSVGRYTDYGGAWSAAPWKGRRLVGKLCMEEEKKKEAKRKLKRKKERKEGRKKESKNKEARGQKKKNKKTSPTGQRCVRAVSQRVLIM